MDVIEALDEGACYDCSAPMHTVMLQLVWNSMLVDDIAHPFWISHFPPIFLLKGSSKISTPVFLFWR
jgi:hypothetical protein